MLLTEVHSRDATPPEKRKTLKLHSYVSLCLIYNFKKIMRNAGYQLIYSEAALLLSVSLFLLLLIAW